MSGDEKTMCVEASPVSTTKSHADNCYEQLVRAHNVLDTVVGHIYGEDNADICQPCSPGLHGTLQENDRLSRQLGERLDGLWNRL